MQTAFFQYPDIVSAKSMKTGKVLHFIPVLYPSSSSSSSSSSSPSPSSLSFIADTLQLSFLFHTLYSDRIQFETKSSSSEMTGEKVYGGLFTTLLMDKYSSKFSTSQSANASAATVVGSTNQAPPSPSPSGSTGILLKISDEVSKMLIEKLCSVSPSNTTTNNKDMRNFIRALLPDHARTPLNSSSSSTSNSKLHHSYGFFPDSQLNNYYFIQCQQKKKDVFPSSSGSSCQLQDQEILLNSIRKELNTDWITASSNQRYLSDAVSFNTDATSSNSNSIQQRCEWRSCLSCVSQSSSKTTPLCEFHSKLKEFIDVTMVSSSSKSKNSTKFLPKSIPDINNLNTPAKPDTSNNENNTTLSIATQTKKDLKMLRSSSILIQEIWDGRLKNTINTFISKTIQELNCKHFISNLQQNHFLLNSLSQMTALPVSLNSNDSAVTVPSCLSKLFSPSVLQSPTWMLWKDRERYEFLVKGLQNNCEILSAILNNERFISREIDYFYDLNCFPQQEVSSIRKEMKAFKDYQTKLLSDLSYGSTNAGGDASLLMYMEDSSNIASNPSLLQSNQTGCGGNNSKESYDLLYQILLEESKFSDLKLLQFTQRRQIEQEMKNAYTRKLMKLKAIEESELKDPASFKNQFNR
jgi:hypothetical protein